MMTQKQSAALWVLPWCDPPEQILKPNISKIIP